MIALDELTKSYGGNKAVNNISLTVSKGETMVLLGTSGCGKTTTLKMINRLIEPDSGSIQINGKNIHLEKREELRRKIGFVMQNTGLFPHYNVAENIAVVPRLLKWDKALIERRTLALLEKLHLPEGCLTMFPHELSGGQQQRVGLARALVADPEILLMDEPFGALDNVTRSSIQAEFKAMEELKRKTIIMVTHDVQEAFELADRICLMDRGEIAQIGTPKELLFKPANGFTKEFFDGERLALEFKSVSIKDLWEYLADTKGDQNREAAPTTTRVWSVMERFSGNKSIDTQFFLDEITGVTKSISFGELTAAFYSYQKKAYHD